MQISKIFIKNTQHIMYLSNWCSSSYIGELDNNIGRCSQCKEMAEFRTYRYNIYKYFKPKYPTIKLIIKG